ncbi:short chain dehydrogenase [Colletotrichum falcatum]|nr:short chain dehydrogenase [Colletotrichum falcatum]
MSSGLTYLITGANRGIGLAFVSLLARRPATTVVAAVRDPSSPSSRALADLPRGEGSRVILVKIDASVESDPAAAVAALRDEHGVAALDVVIANAGISNAPGRVADVAVGDALEHFAVNSVAPLVLFRAAAPLLKAGAAAGGSPVFVGMASLMGSIGAAEQVARLPVSVSPYGASKAALSWFVRRLSIEEPWLTAFVFHPGLVETDMAGVIAAGNDVKAYGAITTKQSVEGMVATLDRATREFSGTFKNYDGADLPW